MHGTQSLKKKSLSRTETDAWGDPAPVGCAFLCRGPDCAHPRPPENISASLSDTHGGPQKRTPRLHCELMGQYLGFWSLVQFTALFPGIQKTLIRFGFRLDLQRTKNQSDLGLRL